MLPAFVWGLGQVWNRYIQQICSRKTRKSTLEDMFPLSDRQCPMTSSQRARALPVLDASSRIESLLLPLVQ
eukprot:793607-Amphidinium_carterae.1